MNGIQCSIYLLLLLNMLLFSIPIHAQNCVWEVDSFHKEKLHKDLTFLVAKSIDKQLIVLGEFHNHLEDLEIDWVTFQELSKKYQKVNLIKEVSFSYALLLNKYIQNGDSTIFKLQNEMHCYYKNYTLHQLKSFYDTGYEFDVIGVDIDYQFTYATQLSLRQLCREAGVKEVKPEYSKSFKRFLFLIDVERDLRNVQKCNRRSLYKFSKKILLDDQKFYKKVFGKNYDTIIRIIKDLQLGVELKKDYVGHTRENLIYERLKMILTENPDSKYFAVYGNAHVNKKIVRADHFVPFVKQLNDDGFSIFTGYRFYAYYDKCNDMRYKDFVWVTDFAFGISKNKTDNYLKHYFEKDINVVIKSPQSIIEGVDFILFLNRPIIYPPD